MDEQQITSKADLRKWRIELPNLYDDSDLDPYEFRLLAHYVRVGNCYESTRTTAEKCKMSPGQVVEKRRTLADKKFIRLGESKQGTISIEILDVWQKNFRKYSARSRSKQARSPHEQNCSPSEPKKEQIEERTIEEVVSAQKPCAPPPSPEDRAKNNAEFDALPSASSLPENKAQPAMVGALLAVCIDDGGNGERYAKTAHWLVKRGYTPEQVREHYGVDGDWYMHDWRGQKGQAPTQKDVRDTIFKAVKGMWNMPQRVQQKPGKLDIIAEGIRLSQERRNGDGRNDHDPVRQLLGDVSTGAERDEGADCGYVEHLARGPG